MYLLQLFILIWDPWCYQIHMYFVDITPNTVLKLRSLHLIAWVLTAPNLLLKGMCNAFLQCILCQITWCSCLGLALISGLQGGSYVSHLGFWQAANTSQTDATCKTCLHIRVPLDFQWQGSWLINGLKYIHLCGIYTVALPIK